MGTTSAGGTFSGTLSLQGFTNSGSNIFAVGIVAGTVMDASGRPVGTLLNGPVQAAVTVSQGTSARLAPSQLTVRPAVATEQQTRPRLLVAQAPSTCGVLNLSLGAITVNALGLTVTTSPITLDISGQSGGTNVLGTLVCQILQTLTNVTGLLGLLNSLLGVLGGLTSPD